jgi:PAS domain S-box-containing protein
MPISSISAAILCTDETPDASLNGELNQDHPDGLSAALRYLPQLTAAAGERLWVVDPELTVLFANRAIDANNRPVAAAGHRLIDLLPMQSREQAMSCMQSVLQTGVPGRFEILRSTTESIAQTAHRYEEVRVAPIRDAQRIVALALHVTDLTHHVMAQRTVVMQAKIIESMLEGVALINDQGEIVIANPAFEALFGFERGLLTGWPMEQLAFAAEFDVERLQLDREAAQSANQSTAQSRRSAGPWSVEFSAQRQDGAVVTLAGAVSCLRDGSAEHRLLVLQDVSERKLLERAMLEAVSHEQYRIGNDLHDGVGQELTGIALMLRCLAGRLAAEHRAALPDVENITQLVNNAVESTRSLARGLSPVNLERGGLRDALAGLAMHARSVYGIKAVFTNRLHPSMVLDAELANHMYRIAQEAVTNAVKHGRAQAVRLQLSSARRRVRLIVTDDGVGMPADVQSASGLGVRIMRYRARMAHGDMRFERAQPNGTRIVCECPIDQPASPRAAERAKRAASSKPAIKPARKSRARPSGARIVKIR